MPSFALAAAGLRGYVLEQVGSITGTISIHMATIIFISSSYMVDIIP